MACPFRPRIPQATDSHSHHRPVGSSDCAVAICLDFPQTPGGPTDYVPVTASSGYLRFLVARQNPSRDPVGKHFLSCRADDASPSSADSTLACDRSLGPATHVASDAIALRPFAFPLGH